MWPSVLYSSLALLGLLVTSAVAVLCYLTWTTFCEPPPMAWNESYFENFDQERFLNGKPLRIHFITWGSRGDIQPNIALGIELANRGHHITVYGLEKFRGVVDAHKTAVTGDGHIAFQPFDDPYVFPMASSLAKPENKSKFPLIVSKYTADTLDAYVDQYVRLAQDADVLIGQYIPLCSMAHYVVAQVLKKPLFMLTHDPFSVTYAEWSYDPSENRVRDYGLLKNVINGRVISVLTGIRAALAVRSVYQKHNLSNAPLEVLSPSRLKSLPMIHTHDRSLWPLPKTRLPDWWLGSGYLRTPEHDEPRHEELKAWITQKERQQKAMIYFAFGSFDHHNRSAITALLQDALEQLDWCAVTLESAVQAEDIDSNSDRIFVASDVPTEWVFSRMTVVGHHGGAGTAAQALRSGKPNLVIPSMFFQSVWGNAIAENGNGLHMQMDDLVLPWLESNGSINPLTKAILTLTTDEVIAAKAKAMRDAHLQSTGTELAADHIETWVKAGVEHYCK